MERGERKKEKALALPKVEVIGCGGGVALRSDGSYDYDTGYLGNESTRIDPKTVSSPCPGVVCTAKIVVDPERENELNRN